ncbi:MAG: type II secretion system protein GspG [Blastocatellia bacterium]|nr:type II secretion system protein GspG [Blastocatellia bacterium]
MAEQTSGTCEQCGANLLPSWRFCMNCHARIPGTLHQPEGQVEEIAHQIASTRRPDVTMVFVPEHREARLVRERRNRRRGIAVAAGCLMIAIASFAWWRVEKRNQALRTTQRRELAARRELDLYARALDLYHTDLGRYPDLKEGLGALLRRPPTLPAQSFTNWKGPYIDGDFSVDPWGNEYVYRVFREGADYQLYSFGPEGEPGGKIFLQVNSWGEESKTAPVS